MDYNKRDMKWNMLILYITSTLIGLELGIRDFSTTLQVLFEKVGGEELLVLINQFSFYSFLLCIFLLGIHLTKYKLKEKIVFMEFLTFFGYFVIAILLKLDKLSAGILFFIFLSSMIINRFLVIMWMTFKMKIIPNESFKKLLGNAIFFQMLAIIAGMSFSYMIISKPYPSNFVELLFVVSSIGFSVCCLYLLLREPEHVHVKEANEKIKLKDLKECAKEDNFWNMVISKVLYNLSFGIVVLYAYFAMKMGFEAKEIVLMGLVSYIFQAVSGLTFGNVKISNKRLIIYAYIFTMMSIISVFMIRNMYLGFAFLGMAEPIVHMGFYGFINTLCSKKKHIYLTTETVLSCTAGLSVGAFSVLTKNFGDITSVTLAMILLIIAIVFTLKLEDKEDVKTNTNDAAILRNQGEI